MGFAISLSLMKTVSAPVELGRCNVTRVAPKVMPLIYFHGNYNRYKEHNNTVGTDAYKMYRNLELKKHVVVSVHATKA